MKFSFMFESFINRWGDLIDMGSIEDHKDFGALHPSFGGLELPLPPALNK